MINVCVPFFKNKQQLDKCQAALAAQTLVHGISVRNDTDTAYGFTRTVNSCLRNIMVDRGGATYAVILNQDCYLRPDALKTMFDFMEAQPKCAIAGIKQLSSYNEDHIIHGGTYECFPAGRHEGGQVSRGDCTISKQVPWVNGACMIVRLEAILEFGLMDETMKMFGSDADWSYTARARGWECWYIADAVCVHEQGASKHMDEKMNKTFEKDMLAFRSKWVDGDLFRELEMEVFPEVVCNEEIMAKP